MICKYYFLKMFIVFVYLTFNSSAPSFRVARKESSCLLHIEKTVFVLLLTNSKCIFHGNLMSWFALQMLLSAEIYWKLSIQSRCLQSVSKSTHAAIVCSGKRADSFMWAFMNSPGRSLILFGEYNTETLFCNFFGLFCKLLS